MGASRPRPVFIVGLDGGTYDVLDILVAAGDMPTLAALRAQGACGVLRSVIPPITWAAWCSFMTGKRPEKHGIYDFRLYDPRAYRDTVVTSNSLRDRTIWELMTAAGRRVAVVHLPAMYPPNPRAGTVVSGFDTPSVATMFTHPPELRDRILAQIPDYFFVAASDREDPRLEQAETFERFVADVERAFEQRTQVALNLLAEGPWDAFMVHYQSTDALQHRVWRYIVERERFRERWERLRRVYRRLDAALGRLLAAQPADALVFVISDHGFGVHAGRFYPNVLLERWGYLARRGRHRRRIARSVRKRLVRLGLARARKAASGPWISQARRRSFAEALPLHWSRTRAYVAAGEIYGLLYLNLRGREPEGTVSPGAEALALAEELRSRLLSVRDPVDGAPVLADVLPGPGLCPGSGRAGLPDLILVPRAEYSVYRDLNYKLWLDRYPSLAGTHRREGVLIVGGRGVRRGHVERGADLVDLAPTILAVAGLAVPDDMDGRVLDELFTEPPPVRFEPANGATGRGPTELSEAEEQEVLDRLRALGYVE